jgi:hypothetical protein
MVLTMHFIIIIVVVVAIIIIIVNGHIQTQLLDL